MAVPVRRSSGSDRIETTTADSVFAFLQKSGIEASHFVIRGASAPAVAD